MVFPNVQFFFLCFLTTDITSSCCTCSSAYLYFLKIQSTTYLQLSLIYNHLVNCTSESSLDRSNADASNCQLKYFGCERRPHLLSLDDDSSNIWRFIICIWIKEKYPKSFQSESFRHYRKY